MKKKILLFTILSSFFFQACIATTNPLGLNNPQASLTHQSAPTLVPGTLTETIEFDRGDSAQIEYPDLNYAAQQDYLYLPPPARIPLVVSMDRAYFTNPGEGEAEILFTLRGPEGQLIQPDTQFFEVPIAITAQNASGDTVFEDPGNWDGKIRLLTTPDLEGGPSRYELTSLSSSVPPEARYLTSPSGPIGEIALNLPSDAAAVTVTLYTFSDFATKSVRALVWHLPISAMPASQQPTPAPTQFPRTISGEEAVALFPSHVAEGGPYPLLCPGETYGGFSILSVQDLPQVYFLNDFLQMHVPDLFFIYEGDVLLVRIADMQEVTFSTAVLSPLGSGSKSIRGIRVYIAPYQESYIVGEGATPPASLGMAFLFPVGGETVDPRRALILAGLQNPDTYLFGRLSCD